MMFIFFIGKYGPQKIHCAMVGQNSRSIPFLKYIVHKEFSGIELQKYRPKDGPILKVLHSFFYSAVVLIMYKKIAPESEFRIKFGLALLTNS